MCLSVFAFSASAESKTTTVSVDGIVEDCYIQRTWDATSTKYYPAWEGYQDGYGYGMRFDNLSGVTSGYITVLFSDKSPIYVFSNGRKHIVKVSVINNCGWTDPTCFEMMITTGTAWAGGQPVDVSFSGDWTHLTFEFNAESSTGEQWYPYGFRYVFLKNSGASAPFYFGSPITIVATTAGDQIVDGVGDKIDAGTDRIEDKLDDQTEQQKGFFQGLLDGILNGIKSFFIPSGDFFTQYFDDWNTWMSDHFGILYYPLDLFIDLCNRLLNLSVPDDPTITFPALQVGDTTLLAAQTYTFDFSGLSAIDNLHNIYLTVVDVIVVIWLVNLAKNKLNEIMSGG